MFKNMIGKKFMDGAMGPFYYDCWGVVVEAYKRHGIDLPEVNISEYRAKEVSRIIEEEAQTPKWKPIKKLEVPCIITFTGGHVGCYIGHDQFIHIRKDMPVCIERITSPLWASKIKGYYQYVE